MATDGKPAPFARFAVEGDFWAKFLGWGARSCPFYVEPLLVAGYTAGFYALCGGARRAVAENLTVVLPGTGRLGNSLRAWRVFWGFAYSMTDAARAQQGEQVCDWEVEGAGNLDELIASDRGGILLTAHMGNYDVAAPLFSRWLGKRLNAVRAPERQAATQEYREAQLRGQESETFAVHYNRPENLVGIDLAQALGRGELVAIQGDRIVGDVSPIPMPYTDGAALPIPRGPFVLASVSRVGIHPVFTARVRWRTYRVLVGTSIEVRGSRDRREAAIRSAAARWLDQLGTVLRGYWFQWFMFEPAFGAGAAAPEEEVDESGATGGGETPVKGPAEPGDAAGAGPSGAARKAGPEARSPDYEGRAFTSFFKLLAARRGHGEARSDRLWASGPGHDPAECSALAFLVLWLDLGLVLAVAQRSIDGFTAGSVAIALAVPLVAFVWTQVLTAVFAVIGNALPRGPGKPDRVARVCAVGFHGRTVLALAVAVAVAASGSVAAADPWLVLATVPWLGFAALDGLAWIARRLTGRGTRTRGAADDSSNATAGTGTA